MANNKIFVFKSVILLKPYLFVLMAVAIVMAIVLPVTTYISSSVKLLYFSIFVGFAIALAVGYLFSKTVTISFTDTDICFDFNGRLKTYAKTEVKGFYSINYQRSVKCTLVIDFYFKDGSVLNLYDYQQNTAKSDPVKHQLLKDFLATAQTELDFEPVSTSKIRTWTNTADVWFAKAPTGA